jgi:hypothetical protein
MKPIGWSKRSVHLQCDGCGAHTRVELWPYLLAVENGAPVRCSGCGVEEVPEDRRTVDTSRTVERRVAVAM